MWSGPDAASLVGDVWWRWPNFLASPPKSLSNSTRHCFAAMTLDQESEQPNFEFHLRDCAALFEHPPLRVMQNFSQDTATKRMEIQNYPTALGVGSPTSPIPPWAEGPPAFQSPRALPPPQTMPPRSQAALKIVMSVRPTNRAILSRRYDEKDEWSWDVII